MVEPYTQFFPVRVRYDDNNNHIYVTDEHGKEWKCWIASSTDKRLFEDTHVRFFQAMREFDGVKECFTILVNQPAEPFEYEESDEWD